VTLTATPRTGFNFVGWNGALAGQPNPAAFTMVSPLAAGADFELIYAVPPTRVDFVATIEQDVQLQVENGTAPYSWRLVSGELPLGLQLSGAGRLSGTPVDLGTFTVTLEAVDAIGLPAVGTITLEGSAPAIPIETLVSPFLLSGPALTPAQLTMLNLRGNGVAGYDLGDFRAWLLANPDLPMSATFAPTQGPRTIVIPMRRERGRDGREEKR
jgi:hypothetical protein